METLAHAFGNQANVLKGFCLLQELFYSCFLALVNFDLHVKLGLGAAKFVEGREVLNVKCLELFIDEISLDVSFFELFLDVVELVCDAG